MYFADAVSIIVACPFILSMTHGVTYTLQTIIAVVFIRIECGFRLGEAFYKRTEGLALSILHHTDTHLARFSANHCADGRAIILVRTASTPFIGSTSRRILRITVPCSFFPRRSGTFRRFRLPDRSRVRSFVRVLHWLATDGELP